MLGILFFIIAVVVLLWIVAVASVFFGLLLLLSGISFFNTTHEPIWLIMVGIGLILFMPVFK
jgi:hypothetical protein